LSSAFFRKSAAAKKVGQEGLGLWRENAARVQQFNDGAGVPTLGFFDSDPPSERGGNIGVQRMLPAWVLIVFHFTTKRPSMTLRAAWRGSHFPALGHTVAARASSSLAPRGVERQTQTVMICPCWTGRGGAIDRASRPHGFDEGH
jgi:hypothetical protein